MFLYIALVDMVPELNQTVDSITKKKSGGGINVRKGLFAFLLQNIGMLMGIFSLYFLAKSQDYIQINI